MLERLKAVPPDPILGILAAFAKDSNPLKIDLGIGVYRDEQGETPLLESVARAERLLLGRQTSKSYLGPAGVSGFNDAMCHLVFGERAESLPARIATVQTPGGTAALRVAAELVRAANPEARVWLSDPSWANHSPIFSAPGLALDTYPYFDPATGGFRFDAMMDVLRRLGPDDVVVFHACCHNPCGVSPDAGQWAQISELASDRGFLPLVDMAYQGFESGVEEDNLAVRLFADRCPELLVASSCSKNFGVYRDRVGALSILTAGSEKAAAIESVIHALTRKSYSMPPAHGPAVIDIILHDPELTALWRSEVAAMRDRINHLRSDLVRKLAAGRVNRDFGFLERQSGMFSFLGLDIGQVRRLRAEFSIYTVDSSRINIASLNRRNIDYFVAALKAVLESS